MSVDFNRSNQFLARTLYEWHGMMSQPTYRVIEYFTRWGNPLTPGIFDNCKTRLRELAYRAGGPAIVIAAAYFFSKKVSILKIGLVIAGLIVVWEVFRLALHCLARFAQKKNSIHVRGWALETQSLHPKVMSWNILGFPAGKNYTLGGCIPFRKRFEEIAALIEKENPEIAVLQECLMDASVTEMFLARFKHQYAHFLIHNGPSYLGLESGLLIMTKCAILDYTFTPFDSNDWTMRRGFATLILEAHVKLPAFAVIGTHMEAGVSPEDAQKRRLQLSQIHTHAKNLKEVGTVFLVGDLNIDAKRDPEQEDLRQVVAPVYVQEPATCTNALDRPRYPHSTTPSEVWLDQIGAIKRDTPPQLGLKDFKVIPVYTNAKGEIDSSCALSDHNPVIATIGLNHTKDE